MKQNHMKNRKRRGRLAATVLALTLTLAGAQSAFAGQWETQEDGGWKYQEDGSYLTEWHQIDNVWYYFDSETGAWVEHPQLTETAVCHLLENAVNRAGWYRNETFPMIYTAGGVTSRKMTVTVMLETAPTVVTTTLGTFDVDLRNGTAREQSTKEVLDLYVY